MFQGLGKNWQTFTYLQQRFKQETFNNQSWMELVHLELMDECGQTSTMFIISHFPHAFLF